ncbi:hypothetical protein CFO_g5465 [Ceratocystis platani]|uniref:Extracellular serine-rich protein n=1 Tax=Ceratocystis fimbriata f. sp. platani TaxID=88771 RepID=A0A0F8CN73_CERFI|nr:hypothetical protein CFO_g5465 [Ceratocystis platani]
MRFVVAILLFATAAMASPSKSPENRHSWVAKRETHVIWVGNTINPEKTYAKAGDAIEFRFKSGTHSVVESNFGSPCHPNGGFSSGDISNSDNKGTNGYTLDIEDDSTLWFYNGAGDRCHEMGDVGVINPPQDEDQTLFEYYKAAKGQSSTVNAEQNGGYLTTF